MQWIASRWLTGLVMLLVLAGGTGLATGLRAEDTGSVQAFSEGEEVALRVTYMGFTAGRITVEVDEGDWEGKDVYKLRMGGKSAGMANWFYSVDDRWISYMDREDLFSWGYDYYQNHEGEKETEKVRFDHDGGVAIENGEVESNIPRHTHDVLTAVYYLRTQPFEVGDEYRFPVHVSGEPYTLKIRVAELERVATHDGWVDGYRLVPEIVDEQQQEEVEEKLEGETTGVEVWVSADEHRLPLQIALPAQFGTLYGYLEEHTPGE